MKKKIAILGSTGSIGKTLLKIIKKNKKDFNIILLTANKNYKLILKQTKSFNVQHVIITDEYSYNEFVKINKNKKIKIYNNFNQLKKIFKTKADYIMSSIVGIEGLKPTLNVIEHTKTIAIANKESIICGWNLIKKKLKKFKTEFIPVDSEHFSIWSLLKNYSPNDVEKIYITASGGPFLKLPKKSFSNISVKRALKHPNWKMGKKITIDSATLMNKVFEVIEAKNIFDLPYNKISILTHPNSYIHAIIKFYNGLTKILAHDPDMKIPISNSLNDEKFKMKKISPINFEILNDLNLKKVDRKKFLFVNILNRMPKYSTLFETVLITINDYFVYKFLKKEISFKKMIYLINKYIRSNEFNKFKKIKPKKVEDIYRLRNIVSSKMDSLVI